MSTWAFWKDVVRRPKDMGAIAPSGPELARLMVEVAEVRPDHVIAELGAGTGSITRAIVAAMPADAAILAFEPGAELAEGLRREFPGVRVAQKYAQELPAELEAWGKPAVDRVISGLPWTIWPAEVQDAILSAVTRSMRPDGRLVTFTYVHSQVLPGASKLKELLGRYFSDVGTTRTAWRNVPPAFCYVAKGPRAPS